MNMNASSILDVTLLEPAQKHPTIFARFDQLASGDALVIHNDHDPKPLYYQLLGKRGNVFVWEYQEKGPEWWKVRITKRNEDEADETLGQIAAKDVSKALIFKKYGLDFCCGGKKTVKQACVEKGLDITKVEHELQLADSMPALAQHNYNEWSLDFLADYIVNIHHNYVRKSLPEIKVSAEKVMKAHGEAHPELFRLHQLVEEVNAEMTTHMIKEERVLFPYIKEIVAAAKTKQPLASVPFGTVSNPINMMEMEHEMVAEKLDEIRLLTRDYFIPGDACGTYRFLFQLLAEFEEDLHLHVHLENNILFPKAFEMENSLAR